MHRLIFIFFIVHCTLMPQISFSRVAATACEHACSSASYVPLHEGLQSLQQWSTTHRLQATGRSRSRSCLANPRPKVLLSHRINRRREAMISGLCLNRSSNSPERSCQEDVKDDSLGGRSIPRPSACPLHMCGCRAGNATANFDSFKAR